MPPESLYRFRTNRRCLALKRGRDVAARVLISDADADTDTDTGAEMQIQMEIQIQTEIQNARKVGEKVAAWR